MIMSRSLMVVGTIVGMVIATPALSQTRSNGSVPDDTSSRPYIALSGGLVLPEPLRTSAGVEATLDDGYFGAGAIGRRFGPIRAEIEGSYRAASVNSASGFGLRAAGTGRVSALSGMVNAYFEPSFGLGSIRPYFGGGIGVSRFRARGVSAIGLPIIAPQTSLGSITGSKTVLAYQGMAGLSGPVTGNVTASFGYRYFATPGTTLTAPLIGNVRIRGLRTHGIEAGLRFAF